MSQPVAISGSMAVPVPFETNALRSCAFVLFVVELNHQGHAIRTGQNQGNSLSDFPGLAKPARPGAPQHLS